MRILADRGTLVAMLIVSSPDHALHRSAGELNDGVMMPAFEHPGRADAVATALAAAGLGTPVAPGRFGPAPILRVHDAAFVRFLEGAHAAWRERHAHSDALPIGFVAPGMRRRRPESVDGQLGYYCFDCGTPITAGTWQAATAAVDVALTAAAAVLEQPAFGLCRPPGHHAGSDFYGGYCYLNNAAIAAQHLRDRGAARVAVLDVDYHHGNGTQEIFWSRDDVLFVSLHADPAGEYPFFSGHADEIGGGAGSGYTRNLPLPRGTAWDGYAGALGAALGSIHDFGPDALVVSFGADTFAGDPLGDFALVQGDYARMGAAVARLRRPTAIVMEGGYAVEELGANVVAFLGGFLAA
jgi:acetoin utilization deacetylase AcuC-like enzyme